MAVLGNQFMRTMIQKIHKPPGHHGIETISSHPQDRRWGLRCILQLY